MTRPELLLQPSPSTRVLSICTGMGLLDRGFIDSGFEVIPGCEVEPRMRAMHDRICGGQYIADSLGDLIDVLSYADPSGPYSGIIGGPPCQSHTTLKAMRPAKFPDLTPQVNELLDVVQPKWFVFENVVPLDIPGALTVKCDAMHYAKPHQSRARWFTYSPNLTPPEPVYSGNVNDLMAYIIVAGKIYGAHRAAHLQGYPECLSMGIPPSDLVLGLANAVHYPLARAWGEAVKRSPSREVAA